MLDLTGYKLTFDEEFNARSISQTGVGTTWADIRPKWRCDAASDMGFGHSSFVDPASGYDPFMVGGGALTITAVPDRTPSGVKGQWESGLITTEGHFSQTYGYFEMRAKLADELGAWDAFWMMPDKPASNPNNLAGHQELDIVEHVGSNEGGVYSTLHTTDATPAQKLQYYSSHPGLTGGYHTYGVNWQADTISFYFDGTYMGSRPTPTDMHGPMYLLANLATQNKPTNDPDVAGVPITMKIDYIRAFSKDPSAAAVILDAISAPDGQDPGLYGAISAALRPALPSPSTTGGTIAGVTPTVVASGGMGDPQAPTSPSLTSSMNAFGSTSHDPQSVGGKVYAVYDGLLGRAPDPLGMEGWAHALNHGLSVSDMAQAFLASPEGQVRAGALDNPAFVEQLYGSTLHRHSDAAGLQGWTSALAQGASRAEVALGFALSPEHLANIQGAFDKGVFVPDADAAATARLYYGILDRAPDAAGLAAWTSAVQHGTALTSVAQQFLASPEAQAKFGDVSDTMFVSNLYDNALGRSADASGLQGWTSALQHGTSRADVAVQIAESQEAQIRLVGHIETGWGLI